VPFFDLGGALLVREPAPLEPDDPELLDPLLPRVEPPDLLVRAGFGLFCGRRLGLLALIASL
jgi:hypothetical protein